MTRPTKKREQERPVQDEQSSPASPNATLTGLPLEILADILLYTCSPPTVLAVSRTCSFLYNSLFLNPSTSFVWRGVRQTCKPDPLPDPGDAWKKSEAEFAAFMFGGGVCEVCGKTTRAMYVSFGAQIRLCGSWFCRRKFLSESIINLAESRDSLLYKFMVPHVESNRCFYPSASTESTWPDNDKYLVRKTDVEKYQPTLEAFMPVYSELRRAANPSSTYVDPEISEWEADPTVRGVMTIRRFIAIMDFSACLQRWKLGYDREYKSIKRQNRTWTKNLAETEGWNLEDLLASQAYGSLQSRKTFLLEKIGLDDVTPIRSTIEAELLTTQAHRMRQKGEATYRAKLIEVKKIYERMRCGAMPGIHTGAPGPSDPASTLALPTLSVFCTLPFVRTLKGSPDPSTIPPNGSSLAGNIRSSPLTTQLVVSDIHAWLIPVQKHLMDLLGYPDGWQSASTRTLPPLKRVTACFFCKRCGEGKVGKKYQRAGCLDLQGICSHICTATQRKNVEEQRQGAPEESESDASNDDGGNRREQRRKGKKKKRRTKTLDWKVDVFEKDEKAIRLVKTVLDLTGLTEEDPSTVSALEAKGGIIRCLSCTGWVVMDFAAAIGHSHRHELMQIRLVPNLPPRDIIPTRKSAPGNEIQPSLLAFRRGATELLSGPTYRARKLRERLDFGCKHCFSTSQNEVTTSKARWKGMRQMDFNALRSHVKAKHGIQDIRDEDFFCHSPLEVGDKRH